MRFGSFWTSGFAVCGATGTLVGAHMLLPVCRPDLRVPVDPMVMAGDASLTGGAICRSVGITARGLAASKVAQTQQTSLCDDEVLLICINDNLGAGRRALELLQLGEGVGGRQHSSGLVLTVTRKRSVAMLGPTLWCSAEMRNIWPSPCSQFVPVIPMCNGRSSLQAPCLEKGH